MIQNNSQLSPVLAELAERANIVTCFEERKTKKFYNTPEETVRRILSVMGIDAQTDEACEKSLKELDEAQWKRLVPPVVVVRTDAMPVILDLRLPAREGIKITWKMTYEDGTIDQHPVDLSSMEVAESREIGGVTYHRYSYVLPVRPPLGYHNIELECKTGYENVGEARCRVIIVPNKCFMSEALEKDKSVWGFPLQLYALKSKNNWGMGNFTDLIETVKLSASVGAGLVGLNPLNVLFHTDPECASPYYSSSRLYLNPLYIDLTAVPDFKDSKTAQEMVSSREFRQFKQKARDSETVDYSAINDMKMSVFDALFVSFMKNHLAKPESSERANDFKRFCEREGRDLKGLAAYQVVCEYMADEGFGTGWRTWPPEYRDPESNAVKELVEEYHERYVYFLYLQWEADRQFAKGGLSCWKNNMSVGLYQDLAVGVAEQGAETWTRQDLYVKGVSIGAPPDRFNPKGQQWGLAPISPIALQEQAYEPFRRIMRANMKNAGALRIDHVMGLLRLYWIPQGMQGSYVQYPFEDMLGIVALESCRRGCVVVGEDLGTVPSGFRQKMTAAGILGMRLMGGQREDGPDGKFKLPEDYDEFAVSGFATHDLPTIMGLWQGCDLELFQKYGFYDTDEKYQKALEHRKKERRLLVEALQTKGLMPANFEMTDELLNGKAAPPDLVENIYCYLAKTPCYILLVQLEDIVGQAKQMNLPGTNMEYPNWRHRLPVSIEELADYAPLHKVAKALRDLRGGCAKPE